MQFGTPKIAILLNGPPRAGKDTAVNAILKSGLPDMGVYKFTQPVKDLAHRYYGIDCAHDHFEVLKDTPLEQFGGLTPRQAYIETSAREKAAKGDDAIAKMLVDAILDSHAQIILNPDCGDDMEALCVADALGIENVLVIRLHKEGKDFSQDCRTWVTSNDLQVVDIENKDGMRREYESEVVARATRFVASRMEANLNYAAS